jgi:hypothetical protein
MKKWDVFISHASEDKESVVIPLYNFLKKSGLRIWIDKMELSIGDSLREKIDEGLSLSRFGVVIISEKFLQKKWPQLELNGLFSLEEDGQKVILPVWCNVDKSTINKYSPILADKLAANIDNGIEHLGKELLNVILKPGSQTPSLKNPTRALLLNQVLDSSESTIPIKDFFQIHNKILLSALGIHESKSGVNWNVEFPVMTIDCIIYEMQTTTRIKKFYVLSFLQAKSLFNQDGNPTTKLDLLVQKNDELRKWVRNNILKAREITQDISSDFQSIIVVGRRDNLDNLQKNLLKEYNNDLFETSIRTYDWLIDATT